MERQRQQPQPTESRTTRTPNYFDRAKNIIIFAVLAGGGVAVGTSAYMEDRAENQSNPYELPTAIVAGAGVLGLIVRGGKIIFDETLTRKK